MSLGQPFVQEPQAFVEECRSMFTRQWEEFEDGNGRAGDNIAEFFATVRKHRVRCYCEKQTAHIEIMYSSNSCPLLLEHI